jgi:hypothetical protein
MVEIRTLRLEDINDENSVKEERRLGRFLDWEIVEEGNDILGVVGTLFHVLFRHGGLSFLSTPSFLCSNTLLLWTTS